MSAIRLIQWIRSPSLSPPVPQWTLGPSSSPPSAPVGAGSFTRPSSRFRIVTLIGYEPAELIGKTVYQFHNPLDAQKVHTCYSTCEYTLPTATPTPPSHPTPPGHPYPAQPPLPRPATPTPPGHPYPARPPLPRPATPTPPGHPYPARPPLPRPATPLHAAPSCVVLYLHSNKRYAVINAIMQLTMTTLWLYGLSGGLLGHCGTSHTPVLYCQFGQIKYLSCTRYWWRFSKGRWV